jgi:hypothetical protein
MTGPEHYREAERLTAQAASWMNADTGWKAHLSSAERIAHRMADLAEAQVHADLASTAATAELTAITAAAHDIRSQAINEWFEAIDSKGGDK